MLDRKIDSSVRIVASLTQPLRPVPFFCRQIGLAYIIGGASFAAKADEQPKNSDNYPL
jgi:hypothetical protein